MKTAVAAPVDPRPLYVLLLEEVVKAARELVLTLNYDVESDDLHAALDALRKAGY